jgi:regulator of protease activity HflC (stomatin/prohibitin superfamily)
VNPLNDFHVVDIKQKSELYQRVELPSQDELTSITDISVQYRAIGTAAETIISDTGSVQQVIDIHLTPKTRSAIREVGKSIPKAEDLFLKETQTRVQTELTTSLAEFMRPKGIEVQAFLMRNTELPQFIKDAIERKKENEQKAEQQVAELRRFETEQQQKIAQAEAEFKAAELQAQQKRVIADAEAYQIEKEGQMLEQYPRVLQFRGLETLTEMSKNPAATIYWMDPTAANPLPLMHLGNTK